jgi:hypothetical protein
MLVSFSKNKSVTVEGRLGLYGNEPFTYLGLTAEDDFYVLQTDDKQLYKELYDAQLQSVKVTGVMNGSEYLTHKVIIVEEFEIIKKK